MNDIVCRTNRAGETIGRCRHRGIVGADQWQVCVPGCLGQMRVNRFDGKCAGNLAGIATAHAVGNGENKVVASQGEAAYFW